MTLFEKMTHTTYAFTTQLSHTEVLVRFSALVRVEGMRATGLVNLSARACYEGLGIKPSLKALRRFLGLHQSGTVAARSVLGPFLPVAEGSAMGGAVRAVLVPTAASRTVDFSQLVTGIPVSQFLLLPPLPPVQPVVCSLVVKFGMSR